MPQGNVHIELAPTHQGASAKPPLTPIEIAQRRAGHDAVALIRFFGGLASAIFAAVGCWQMLVFAVDMAERPIDQATMVLCSGAISIAILVLPTMAALMHNSYPKQSRMVRDIWAWLVVVCFIVVVLYTLFMQQTAVVLNRGMIGQVVVLSVSLVALAGSGMMTEWTILSTAESHRLAYGEAGPMQQSRPGTGLLPVDIVSGGMTGPVDIFSGWADGRLIEAPGKKEQATELFLDYCQTCELNGIEPMKQAAFFKLLTDRAVNSAGRVIKEKTEGIIYYRGWTRTPNSLELHTQDMRQISAH